MTKHHSSNLMDGRPCKCATKCSVLGLRLWNSSLSILWYTLARKWQDLLLWPIQYNSRTLLIKGRLPRSRNRLKRLQTVEQGETNKNKAYNCKPQLAWGVKLWHVVFLFACKSWFILKSNHCVSFWFCWFLFCWFLFLIIARMMPGRPLKEACSNASKVQ